MDPTINAALFAFFGALISVLISVAVAWLTTRRELEKARRTMRDLTLITQCKWLGFKRKSKVGWIFLL